MPIAARSSVLVVVTTLLAVLGSNSASAANCRLLTAELLLQKISRAGDDGVAAIVDDSIVTKYDVANRVSLYLALTGADPDAGELKRIEATELQELKYEKAWLSTAERKKIVVSSVEVNGELDSMMARAGISMGQLKSILSRAGVGVDVLRSQIAVDVMRRKLKGQQGGFRYRLMSGPCLRKG